MLEENFDFIIGDITQGSIVFCKNALHTQREIKIYKYYIYIDTHTHMHTHIHTHTNLYYNISLLYFLRCTSIHLVLINI